MLGNIDIEKAFIYCIIFNNKLYYKYQLRSEDFTDMKCSKVYSAIKTLIDSSKEADVVSVSDLLLKSGVTATSFLSEIMTSEEYRLTNIAHYYEILKEFSGLRKFRSLETLIPQILDSVGKDPQAAFNTLSTTITDMLISSDSHSVTVQEAYRELLNDIQTPKPKANFMRTGLKDLDDIISGWRNGNLDIIAARPRVGKTASALNFAFHAARSGHRVFFWSGEMTIEECSERLMSMASGVTATTIKNRELKPNEIATVTKIADVINPMNWHFTDKPRMHIDDLEILIKRMYFTHNIEIVFIDQLSKIYGGKGFKRTEQIEDITGRLKALAKELDIPIILLAQINRDGADCPTLENLKDSGAIEQDADVVIILHRPEFVEDIPENKGILEMHIEKDRHGQGGSQRFYFLTRIQSIVEMGKVE